MNLNVEMRQKRLVWNWNGILHLDVGIAFIVWKRHLMGGMISINVWQGLGERR